MSIEPVHIGFDNIIAMNRVIIMLSPKQQPIRRLIQEARNKGMLVDATHARKAKSVIILDTGHTVLAAISSEAIIRRLAATHEEDSPQSETDEE